MMQAARLCVLAAIAAGFGGAGSASAADPGPDNLVLSCTGVFAADGDRDRLVAVFGAKNVSDAEIDVGEGMTEPGTVLYADDPERRLEIFWAKPEAQARPATVMLRGETSRWHGPAGITLGMPLPAVEKANGGPFDILGFGWDQGGYVPAWHGELDRATGASRCPLSVRFDSTADDYDGASGDAVFKSSDKGVRQAKPVVGSISIGWPAE